MQTELKFHKVHIIHYDLLKIEAANMRKGEKGLLFFSSGGTFHHINLGIIGLYATCSESEIHWKKCEVITYT